MCGKSDEPPVAFEELIEHHVQTSDYEIANEEMKRFGFDYHTQGAEFATNSFAVWFCGGPKESAEDTFEETYYAIIRANIFDEDHWFAIRLDGDSSSFLKEAGEKIRRLQTDLHLHETDIMSPLVEFVEDHISPDEEMKIYSIAEFMLNDEDWTRYFARELNTTDGTLGVLLGKVKRHIEKIGKEGKA